MPIDHGVQPLDALMNEAGLGSASLVNVSREQLTFKAVQKARKGKHLSLRMRVKILNALRALLPGRDLKLSHLFNY